MQIQTQNFLNILNNVIHKTPLKLTKPVDYAKILSMAKNHNIFPLAYEKLCEDSDFLKNPQFNEYMITAAGAMTAQARRTAASMTTAAISGRRKGQKHRKIMVYVYVIFAKRSQMVNENAELSDKPWLLPVCWVRRWCRFLEHSKESDGNLAKESMEISKRRIELLKKYDVL